MDNMICIISQYVDCVVYAMAHGRITHKNFCIINERRSSLHDLWKKFHMSSSADAIYINTSNSEWHDLLSLSLSLWYRFVWQLIVVFSNRIANFIWSAHVGSLLLYTLLRLMIIEAENLTFWLIDNCWIVVVVAAKRWENF